MNRLRHPASLRVRLLVFLLAAIALTAAVQGLLAYRSALVEADALFDYQMQCSSKPGENVLDLFAGSGTTIMAAEQNGRNAYCMEFDPRYADVIVDRWEKFTGKKAVLLHD